MEKDFRAYFKNKKVTVLGLGLLGRGIGDTIFMAKSGARLVVTDLKKESELAPSLRHLQKYQNILYVLGRHRLKDFRNRDFVLKAAGVSLDSPYVAEARLHNIPIEMSTSLFVKLLPKGVTVVGVTGTRGKSTVTHLIYHILKIGKKRVHLGGNVRGVSTLSLLPKIKSGDMVILELDSWQLQGFGESNLSPHIAVFTNFMPDHMNYYKGSMARYWHDKANIFRHQSKQDFLVAGKEVAKIITSRAKGVRGELVVPKRSLLPKSWQPRIRGVHNRDNILLAIAVAKILKVATRDVKKAVESFKGVPGRLEYIKSYRGVALYNDTTATTPDATLAALAALGKKKNIILIMGGADKGLIMEKLIQVLPKYCKAVVLLSGTGTNKLRMMNKELSVTEVGTLKEAVAAALKRATKGDVILFSPAFASFGMFKNEFDRGEQFNTLIEALK